MGQRRDNDSLKCRQSNATSLNDPRRHAIERHRANFLISASIVLIAISIATYWYLTPLRASINADVAAIDTAQTQLDYTTITAPSDGRMGIRQIDPGNLEHAPDAQPIAVLMRISPSAVLFTLPSRILDDARSALAPGPVEVTAFDQDGRRALSTAPIVATPPSAPAWSPPGRPAWSGRLAARW